MIKISTGAWICCYFVKCCLKAERPRNPAYPKELITLGDHLRKVRLDKGLSQPQVAKMLKCSTDMVTNWELNRNEPTAKFAKSILAFIGYMPFIFENTRVEKQIYYARLCAGHTQKAAAQEINCDASNLRYIELGQRKPKKETEDKILKYVEISFAALRCVGFLDTTNHTKHKC